MIKLIGIDCDDTILDSNKNISDKTCSVISNANKKGIKCVLTTGRPFVEKTIEYYKALNILYLNYIKPFLSPFLKHLLIHLCHLHEAIGWLFLLFHE